MATVKEKMTAIADAIRAKTGGTELLTLDGMATDIPKVFEAGKQSEMTIFWNALQNFGNGVYGHYRMFHGANWTDEAYNPIYPIKSADGTNLQQVYFSSGITNTKVPIILKGINASLLFAWSKIRTVPLIVVDENTTFTDTFLNANNLENVTFEGTIGKKVSFSSCTKLTHASLMSITNALKDYSELGTTCTLTLGTTNLGKLTDEEKALATQKGWTLA